MKVNNEMCLIRPLQVVEACKEIFPTFTNWDFIVRDLDEAYVVGYCKEHNLDFRVYFYLKDRKMDARVLPRHKNETSENVKALFQEVNKLSKWDNLPVTEFKEMPIVLSIYLKDLISVVNSLA